VKITLEAEIMSNSLGRWVELYIADGERRRSIASLPIYDTYPNDDAAMLAIVADIFCRALA
jgi:hypothetical protein